MKVTHSQESQISSSCDTAHLLPLMKQYTLCCGTNAFEDLEQGEKEEKKEHRFPWMLDFADQCRCSVGMNSITQLERLLTSYLKNVIINVKDCYQRPNRAGKLKKFMSEALRLFYTFSQYIQEPKEHSSYLNKMSELMSMYIDIELKSSLQCKQSIKNVTCRLTSSLFLFLHHSESHILDSILGAKLISKHYQDICSPVIEKVLNLLSSSAMHELLYVRYLLVYKVWKRVVEMPEKRRLINKIASQKLIPPLKFKERARIFKEILPNIPKCKKHITLFYMQAKFSLKSSCMTFLKMFRNSHRWSINISKQVLDPFKCGFKFEFMAEDNPKMDHLTGKKDNRKVIKKTHGLVKEKKKKHTNKCKNDTFSAVDHICHDLSVVNTVVKSKSKTANTDVKPITTKGQPSDSLPLLENNYVSNRLMSPIWSSLVCYFKAQAVVDCKIKENKSSGKKRKAMKTKSPVECKKKKKCFSDTVSALSPVICTGSPLLKTVDETLKEASNTDTSPNILPLATIMMKNSNTRVDDIGVGTKNDVSVTSFGCTTNEDIVLDPSVISSNTPHCEMLTHIENEVIKKIKVEETAILKSISECSQIDLDPNLAPCNITRSTLHCEDETIEVADGDQTSTTEPSQIMSNFMPATATIKNSSPQCEELMFLENDKVENYNSIEIFMMESIPEPLRVKKDPVQAPTVITSSCEMLAYIENKTESNWNSDLTQTAISSNSLDFEGLLYIEDESFKVENYKETTASASATGTCQANSNLVSALDMASNDTKWEVLPSIVNETHENSTGEKNIMPKSIIESSMINLRTNVVSTPITSNSPDYVGSVYIENEMLKSEGSEESSIWASITELSQVQFNTVLVPIAIKSSTPQCKGLTCIKEESLEKYSGESVMVESVIEPLQVMENSVMDPATINRSTLKSEGMLCINNEVLESVRREESMMLESITEPSQIKWNRAMSPIDIISSLPECEALLYNEDKIINNYINEETITINSDTKPLQAKWDSGLVPVTITKSIPDCEIVLYFKDGSLETADGEEAIRLESLIEPLQAKWDPMLAPADILSTSESEVFSTQSCVDKELFMSSISESTMILKPFSVSSQTEKNPGLVQDQQSAITDVLHDCNSSIKGKLPITKKNVDNVFSSAGIGIRSNEYLLEEIKLQTPSIELNTVSCCSVPIINDIPVFTTNNTLVNADDIEILLSSKTDCQQYTSKMHNVYNIKDFSSLHGTVTDHVFMEDDDSADLQLDNKWEGYYEQNYNENGHNVSNKVKYNIIKNSNTHVKCMEDDVSDDYKSSSNIESDLKPSLNSHYSSLSIESTFHPNKIDNIYLSNGQDTDSSTPLSPATAKLVISNTTPNTNMMSHNPKLNKVETGRNNSYSKPDVTQCGNFKDAMSNVDADIISVHDSTQTTLDQQNRENILLECSSLVTHLTNAHERMKNIPQQHFSEASPHKNSIKGTEKSKIEISMYHSLEHTVEKYVQVTSPKKTLSDDASYVVSGMAQVHDIININVDKQRRGTIELGMNLEDNTSSRVPIMVGQHGSITSTAEHRRKAPTPKRNLSVTRNSVCLCPESISNTKLTVKQHRRKNYKPKKTLASTRSGVFSGIISAIGKIEKNNTEHQTRMSTSANNNLLETTRHLVPVKIALNNMKTMVKQQRRGASAPSKALSDSTGGVVPSMLSMHNNMKTTEKQHRKNIILPKNTLMTTKCNVDSGMINMHANTNVNADEQISSTSMSMSSKTSADGVLKSMVKVHASMKNTIEQHRRKKSTSKNTPVPPINNVDPGMINVHGQTNIIVDQQTRITAAPNNTASTIFPSMTSVHDSMDTASGQQKSGSIPAKKTLTAATEHKRSTVSETSDKNSRCEDLNKMCISSLQDDGFPPSRTWETAPVLPVMVPFCNCSQCFLNHLFYLSKVQSLPSGASQYDVPVEYRKAIAASEAEKLKPIERLKFENNDIFKNTEFPLINTRHKTNLQRTESKSKKKSELNHYTPSKRQPKRQVYIAGNTVAESNMKVRTKLKSSNALQSFPSYPTPPMINIADLGNQLQHAIPQTNYSHYIETNEHMQYNIGTHYTSHMPSTAGNIQSSATISTLRHNPWITNNMSELLPREAHHPNKRSASDHPGEYSGVTQKLQKKAHHTKQTFTAPYASVTRNYPVVINSLNEQPQRKAHNQNERFVTPNNTLMSYTSAMKNYPRVDSRMNEHMQRQTHPSEQTVALSYESRPNTLGAGCHPAVANGLNDHFQRESYYPNERCIHLGNKIDSCTSMVGSHPGVMHDFSEQFQRSAYHPRERWIAMGHEIRPCPKVVGSHTVVANSFSEQLERNAYHSSERCVPLSNEIRFNTSAVIGHPTVANDFQFQRQTHYPNERLIALDNGIGPYTSERGTYPGSHGMNEIQRKTYNSSERCIAMNSGARSNTLAAGHPADASSVHEHISRQAYLSSTTCIALDDNIKSFTAAESPPLMASIFNKQLQAEDYHPSQRCVSLNNEMMSYTAGAGHHPMLAYGLSEQLQSSPPERHFSLNNEMRLHTSTAEGHPAIDQGQIRMHHAGYQLFRKEKCHSNKRDFIPSNVCNNRVNNSSTYTRNGMNNPDIALNTIECSGHQFKVSTC